jgi:hypothetical protein
MMYDYSMKLSHLKYYIVGTTALLPSMLFAQTTQDSATTGDTRLDNPLSNGGKPIDDIGKLFGNLLTEIIIPVSIALGIVFIIWAGFNFILAQGNGEKLVKARGRLFATIIGVTIIISAQILLDILLATVTELTNVN